LWSDSNEDDDDDENIQLSKQIHTKYVSKRTFIRTNSFSALILGNTDEYRAHQRYQSCTAIEDVYQ